MNDNFPLSRDQYELLHLIGKGPFSEVYLAKCRANGRLVSAKLMDFDTSEFDLAQMRKEMVFWHNINHPNMAHFYGSFRHGSTIWLLSEYVNGGSIHDIVQFGYNHGFRDETLIAIILREILNFLLYFHKKSQAHRHLQSSNVLVSTSGNVKVCDYGFSAGLIDNSRYKNTRLVIYGTPCYTPPEVISEGECSTAADIWALGIIAIELAIGTVPHHELTPMEQIITIIAENPPRLNSDRFSPQLRDFVSLCLQSEPKNRPTAIDLLRHPFIRKALECSYIEKVLMNGLPSIEQRAKAIIEQKKKQNLQPFIGHENPVLFRFDVKDLEENGAENPENLVKTAVGKFILTIKEPKPVSVLDDEISDQQNTNKPQNSSNSSSVSNNSEINENANGDNTSNATDNTVSNCDNAIDCKKMSLNDIVSKITEMEMTLATMEMDNFEMSKKISQYNQIISQLKANK